MNAASSATKTKLTPSQVRLRVLLVILLLLSPFGAMHLWTFGKVIRANYAASKIGSLGGQVFSVFGDTNAAAAATVSFAGRQIKDADLGCLNGLEMIYGLDLDNTPITDAGLDFLKSRTELRFLSLKDTAVTDAGLKKLEGLTELQRLCLDGTKITDAGLAHLKGLVKLTNLNLARTRITAAGIERIEAIPHLEGVDLEGAGVSKAEWDRLQKRLTDRTPPDDCEDW